MTAAFRLAPVAAALAVLGAHFYRAGSLAPLAFTVAAFALLFVRRRAAAWVVQATLAAGAVEWLRTLAALVAQRQAAGLPWLRLALILGTVALLTAAAALAFRQRGVRARCADPPG